MLNHFYVHMSFQKIEGTEIYVKMKEKKCRFHFETPENLNCISRAVLYACVMVTQQRNTGNVSKLRKKKYQHTLMHRRRKPCPKYLVCSPEQYCSFSSELQVELQILLLNFRKLLIGYVLVLLFLKCHIILTLKFFIGFTLI